jgi:hypothetical protein
MFKKHISPILVIIIVASSFLTSFAIVAKLNGGSVINPAGGGSYASGYTAGMDAAKKKLALSGMFPSITETKTVTGTVKSIGDNQFVITVGRISPNPLDEQGPSERTVKVNGETQITKKIPLTPDEQNAAQKAFQESIAAGKPIEPPSPFKNESATIADITIGMNVTVTAADNIKDAATIVASAIDFVNAPTATPMPVTTTPPTAPTPIPMIPTPTIPSK